MSKDIIPDPAEIRKAEDQGLVFSQDHKTLLKCHNKEIEEITIPDGITEIGSMAFSPFFKKLTKIKLPDSLIKIGTSAFENCELLSEIVIPNSVTSMELQCYSKQSNLERLRNLCLLRCRESLRS